MTAYPLCWPAGQRRMVTRIRAVFGKKSTVTQYKVPVSVAQGVERVMAQLRLLGVESSGIIISTNLRLRRDGFPLSDQAEPADPGVAVYWKTAKDAQHKVLAIDLYNRVADNLAAVAATLEYLRGIARHGGAAVMERAFTGFVALPSPNDWRHVLGFEYTPTFEQAKARYRELAMKNHSDQGGSDARMAELNGAWESAQRELRS